VVDFIQSLFSNRCFGKNAVEKLNVLILKTFKTAYII
jgi:hypothetical protein